MNSSVLVSGKFIFQKNPIQDFLSSLNAVMSTNESTQIIAGHVIYTPAYNSSWHPAWSILIRI